MYLLLLDSRGASRLANSTESAKFKKYSSLTTIFHFPLSVLRLLGLGDPVHIRWCGKKALGSWSRLEIIGLFNFQFRRLLLMYNGGNAASVMATIPSSQDWAEFVSLPLV